MKWFVFCLVVAISFLASCNTLAPTYADPPQDVCTLGVQTNGALDVYLIPIVSPVFNLNGSSTPIPTPTTMTEPSTPVPSPGQTGVLIRGSVALGNGSGLANARIYLSLAAYPGEIIAATDDSGIYQSDLKFIPGDENVTVWAEMEGYIFNPTNFHWRHYYGMEERTLDFTAVASSSTSIP